jgi:hypothetical protein
MAASTSDMPDKLPDLLPVGTIVRLPGQPWLYESLTQAYLGDFHGVASYYATWHAPGIPNSTSDAYTPATSILWERLSPGVLSGIGQSVATTPEPCRYCEGSGEYPLGISIVSPCDQCGAKPGPRVSKWT